MTWMEQVFTKTELKTIEKDVKKLINDGKGDSGRLEHILSTLKKGHTLYVSDREYLENLLTESRKINDIIQSKEPKITESYSEYADSENESKITTIQPTEIELLRKEIHKLQDKNHIIEEHLRKQPNQKIRKGQAVGGVILMAIGMVMVVGGRRNGNCFYVYWTVIWIRRNMSK